MMLWRDRKLHADEIRAVADTRINGGLGERSRQIVVRQGSSVAVVDVGAQL